MQSVWLTHQGPYSELGLNLKSAMVAEQFQSSFRAVSEQFQSSFRAVSEQFQGFEFLDFQDWLWSINFGVF